MLIFIFSAHLIILLNIKSTEAYTLHIMHINDIHGKIQPTKDGTGEDCSQYDMETERCLGGLARLKYKIDNIRLEYDNTILLNVGDLAQGALWYTIFGWEMFSDLFNQLNLTALMVGSHEFDFGPEGLTPLLEKVNCPVLCCNIDDRAVPEFQNKYKKSIVLIMDGIKIGLIGYITERAKIYSNPGLLNFYNEIDSIETEARRLHEVENVSIIIAAGFAGFSIDKNIAEIPFVDVVVGGRSHTFLYTGTPPSMDVPHGPYPTVVQKQDNSIALVVQAGNFGKYLGLLSVTFHENGSVDSWIGNPILMDSTIEEDPDIKNLIDKWNIKKTRVVSEKVGETHVFIDGRETICRSKECSMGNILTDSFVFLGLKFATEGQWNFASIGLIHGGGIRDSIDERLTKGEITREAIFEVLPFKNQIHFVEITGETLWEALEYGSRMPDDSSSWNSDFLQVSGIRQQINFFDQLNYHGGLKYYFDAKFNSLKGLKFTLDLCAGNGSRVKNVSVLCNECRVPKYFPLKNDSFYRIVVPDYLAKNYRIISSNLLSHQAIGVLDSDALVQYLKTRGSIITGTERRIVLLGESGCRKMNRGQSQRNQIRHIAIVLLINVHISYLLF